MCVVALLAAMLGFNSDGICPCLDAVSTTVAAISALLVAVAIRTPCTFAIDWAGMFIATLVHHMIHMFALATTVLCWNFNDVLARLTACSTVRAAI